MRRALLAALTLAAFAPVGTPGGLAYTRPVDIVDVQTVIPDLVQDIRYHTDHNFVGRPITGYAAAKCLLTRPAAEALAGVQAELRGRGLSLKVYDCYRPERAVADFVAWAKDLDDQRTKTEFYPAVAKENLFRDGYIAERSGHSRGSTLDLTVTRLPTPEQSPFDPSSPQQSCERPMADRFPDNSVDMGTGFDCFSPLSHTSNPAIRGAASTNRELLASLMARHGFVNLPEEWWHYTLKDEPYPDTYFDFPVE